jgi:hypothetical protein
MLFDTVIAIVVYAVSKFVSPLYSQDILWLIASIQPVILSLIIGIAVEDAAAMKNGDNRGIE